MSGGTLTTIGCKSTSSEDSSAGGETNNAGWIQVNDGTYTQASPLVLNQGVRTLLQINPVSFVDFETFPNGQNIIDSNGDIDVLNVGDAYQHVIIFKADITINDTFLRWDLDIGGSFGNIRTVPNDEFRNGAITYTDRSIDWNFYQGSTFAANKGKIYITATELTRIYDIIYIFYRHNNGVSI